MSATRRTDMLVVGAGPTGLALAATLQRAGIAPLVVDKLAAAQNTSRAAVLHAHTLEDAPAQPEIGHFQRPGDEHRAGRRLRAGTPARRRDLGMRNPLQRALRNAVLGLVGHVPAAREHLALDLSGISRRQFAL